MALDFFAGCLGGCGGIIVGYPLDTVKVHMQTQDYRNPQYRGTWHCFRTLLGKESVTGLYRGMSSPMAGVAVVNAIVFGVYGQTQKYLTNSDLSSHFFAGAAAGIAQTPICSPIELAKTRLQLQSRNTTKFSGPMDCLRHIYRNEGYRGVFRGFGITLTREAPSYGIYFVTYEAMTRTSSNEQISTLRMLLAGGFAGTASWVFSYPIDVLKSRIQAECSNRYSSSWDCLMKSVKAEGYSCLYRGLTSTILRAFPTNAATFAIVTWTFRLLGQGTEEGKIESGQNMRTTINVVPDEYEPVLNKWNVLLQRVSNNAMFQRSYYSSLPSSMDLTIMSSNTSLDHTCMRVSRIHREKRQIECSRCHNMKTELLGEEECSEIREDFEEIEWSVVTETFVKCSTPSTVLSHPPSI